MIKMLKEGDAVAPKCVWGLMSMSLLYSHIIMIGGNMFVTALYSAADSRIGTAAIKCNPFHEK